jgi:hypothetical protein
MTPIPPFVVAGTTLAIKSWSAEGRINAASDKLDIIDKRQDDFLKKALPQLKKTHPKHDICRGTKKTARQLGMYEHPNSHTQIMHLNVTFLAPQCEGISWSVL